MFMKQVWEIVGLVRVQAVWRRDGGGLFVDLAPLFLNGKSSLGRSGRTDSGLDRLQDLADLSCLSLDSTRATAAGRASRERNCHR
jgi:hypothetical protein